jgi:CRP-like cAMP-binding protein
LQDDTAVKVRRTYQRTLAPGEVVFDEGEPGDHLYVIQAGEVELVRETSSERRVVARLGPGAFFGELGVVLGSRAVAVSSTRLIALDRETLEAMCLDQPEIAVRMIRILVSRLIESERRLAALGVDDLMRPIVRAILRHAEPQAGIELHFSGKLRELAASAGLSMLEAHRALHQLIDQELLTLEDEVLKVPDPENLNAVLDA